MWFYEVAPTKIVRSEQATFTYHFDSELSIGQVVTIPVGKQTLNGVIISQVTKPKYETKPISSVIEEIPLPQSIVDLSLWMSTYYRTPLATVLQTVLPRGLTTNAELQRPRKIASLHEIEHKLYSMKIR